MQNNRGIKENTMSRKITDKMFKFIDDKLKNHGAAQLAIKNNDARSLFIYAAEACVGIKESGGSNKGLYVVELQKTVDNKAQSEPWCMAAVQTWLAYVEKKLGVKSPIFNSEHCMTTWRKTPATAKVKKIPAPGAIIIWKQKSSDSGHTGIVLDFQGDKKNFESLEGNTGSGNMRDGDGIYIKQRSKVKDGSLVIQGYLIPFDKAV